MHFSNILAVSQFLAAGLVAAKPVSLDRRELTGRSTVQSVGPWTYNACAIEPFNNGGSGRMFTDAVKTDSLMTIEMCADFCSSYTYFGVQYASECYCGNTIADGTGYEVDDSKCNFQCAGNADEYCGGSGHASLYKQDLGDASDDGITSTSTSTTAATPLTSSSLIASTVEATTSSISSVSSSSTSSAVAAATSAITSSSRVASTSTDAATLSSSVSSSSSSSSSKSSSSTAAPTSSTTSKALSSSTTSSITTFVTSTKTSTVATATSTPAFFSLSSCPTLSVSLSAFNVPFRFSPYYSGSGYTENSANPGNLIPSVVPAKTYTIAGTYNACQAAQQCLIKMQSLKLAYLSFDLHYLTTTKSWECTAYACGNVDAKYFNVPNPAVSHAYGFNGLLKF